MELDLLHLLLVLAAALLGGRIAGAYGLPPVLGEILVGIVLGPPLLGWLVETPALQVLADLGVLLMMVYIGLELDPRELGRVSRTGLLAAVGSFAVPFALGWIVAAAFGFSLLVSLFVGLALGVTSLATKSRVLIDLGILDTRIAHVMVAGAVISDTLALLVLTGVLGVAGAGLLGAGSLALAAGKVTLFFAAAWFLGMHALPALYRWMRKRGATGRTSHVLLVVILAVAFSLLSELAGLHAIVGAFVAGLVLRESIASRKLAFALTEVVRDVSIGFLAPIFFVTAGFQVTLDVFGTDLGLLVAIVAVAIAGRIVGTAVFYLPSGHGWREGLTVGAGMTGRGAVEIVVAGIGLQAGIVPTDVFSILVFMAIATTATAPLLLKAGVVWLERHGELAPKTERRRGILIVGAGPLARILARQLRDAHPVTLVDTDAANVQEADLEGLHALVGDPLESDVLRTAGIEAAGTMLTLTPNALVNVLAAQRAKEQFVVSDVRAALTDEGQGGLFHVLETFGGRPAFAFPVDIAALNAYLAARAMAGLEEDLVTLDASELGRLEPKGLLPLAVRRGSGMELFEAWQALEPGDQVVALALPSA